MISTLNVIQIVVLCVILIGVVMIFMRQNNTCVMENDEDIEEFGNGGGGYDFYKNKKVHHGTVGIRRGDRERFASDTFNRTRAGRIKSRMQAKTKCNRDDSCLGFELNNMSKELTFLHKKGRGYDFDKDKWVSLPNYVPRIHTMLKI